MLEQIIIRHHDRQAATLVLDPGLLAESLLFYGRVHLLLNSVTLDALLKSIGPDTLLSLLRSNRITASFLTDMLGVVTEDSLGIRYQRPTAFSVTGHQDGRKYSKTDGLIAVFERALGKSHKTHRLAKEFVRLTELKVHEPVIHKPNGQVARVDENGLTGQAETDIKDIQYLRAVFEAALRREVPQYQLPPNWQLDVLHTSRGFVIATNLDFDAINGEYRRTVPASTNSITVAWLLTNVLEARADLHFAADYMSELASDPLSSSLARLRFNDMLKRRIKSEETIEAFQDAELAGATAIREAINSGSRTFDEFLSLLDKADRFKEWLKGRNPDANLLEEYHREVTKGTWLETLPAKVVRYAICTLGGIGAEALAPGGTGIAAGAGLAAADTFLLERVAKGWRPSQFVDGPLLRFVDRK